MNINKYIGFLIFLIALLALLIVGCQSNVGAISEAEEFYPSPLVPINTPLVPKETEKSISLGILLKFGIALDVASPLVEGISAETIPASEGSPSRGSLSNMQPAHTVIRLFGYPEMDTLYVPQISIYPVDTYARLSQEAKKQIEDLQSLLSKRPHQEQMSTKDPLPYLPYQHAVQVLHARPEFFTFRNGEGLRYLTQYVQDASPIVNRFLFYTFQGLTDDGKYYVSVVFPVHNDALPKDIPEAQTQGFDGSRYMFDQDSYEEYLAKMQEDINRLGDASFAPNLTELDALVQSIDLTEYRGPSGTAWAPGVAPAPDEVVDDFLGEYLSAGGFPAGAYLNKPVLNMNFVSQIESLVAAYHSQGMEPNSYDPILMTRLGPNNVGAVGLGLDHLVIRPARFDGNTASVIVERHWHYTKAISPIQFTLQWNGSLWQITGVSSNVASAPTDPEQVAEQLFAMFVASGGQFASPAEWLREIDPVIVTPNGTVDICDDSWPVGFTIEGSFSQPASLHLSSNIEEEAFVLVYLPFSGGVLTVRLTQQHDTWQVNEVICGDLPQGRALSFFIWYLNLVVKTGETQWYRITNDVAQLNFARFYIAEDLLYDPNSRLKEDLFLSSMGVPDRFYIESGPEKNIVMVYMEHHKEEQVHLETRRLIFKQEKGHWLICNIESVLEE